MKLFEQMMRKKLELSEEGDLNKHYLRRMSNFYSCLCIANSILKHLGKEGVLTEEDIDFRNALWKKIVRDPEEIDQGAFKKLQECTREDLAKIILCFEAIEERKEEGGAEFGDIFIEDTIGVLEYEYPDEFE